MRKMVASLMKEEQKREEQMEAQASKDIEQIKEIFSTFVGEKKPQEKKKSVSFDDNTKAHAMAVQLREIMSRKGKKSSDNKGSQE